MKFNIEFTSKLIGLSISDRNIAFEALSDEDKRKEIAWDSLQLIQQEILAGSNGHYWDDFLWEFNNKDNTPKQFQENLCNLKEKCTVCARGAMMLSQIRLGNQLQPGKMNVTSGDSLVIRGFDKYTFFDMESEYENSDFGHPYEDQTTEKLANICCNIISNGDFKILDHTNYLI